MSLTKELLNDFVSGDIKDEAFKPFFFAVCSALAYRNPERGWTKHFEALGVEVHFYDENGAQCYVLEDDNKIIVAFRGTEPKQWSDIKADLSFRKTWHRGDGKVHRGFMIETWKLFDELAMHVYRTDKQVYITGHSLGGAMATLYSMSCRPQYSPQVYTYGSPRVGNMDFCQTYDNDHVRVVNNNDAVTSVPPSLFGFRHTVKPLYINHYGHVRNLTPWQRLKDKVRGHFSSWRKFEFFDSLRDHSIDKYCQYMHRHWKESLKSDN